MATPSVLKGKRAQRSIAVMQPYFFPYAPYFSLLAHVDEFVIFDCVQFRRRGRIHRTEVPGPTGEPEWLTLPIAQCSRETLIRNVSFAETARESLDERLDRHEWLHSAKGEAARLIKNYLSEPLPAFNEFLERGLRLAAQLLELKAKISRSSTLEIPHALRGQDRILAIVEKLGGSCYVNLPSGRDLYDPATFASAGVELAFLPYYAGEHMYMLHSLMQRSLTHIRADVLQIEPQRA